MIRPNRKKILISGFKRGAKGFSWMMKILIPVSLFTAILAWSGLLEKGRFLIEPAMNWLNLPSFAALPLLLGVSTNLYGAIASMAMLPLTKAQMTLIAVFLLIAHGLIQESAIQGKSGINPFKAAFYRLLAAVITVKIIGPMVGAGETEIIARATVSAAVIPFGTMLVDWFVSTIVLSVKIWAMITGVMILLEFARAFGWIDRVVRICRPLLRLLGLGDKAGVIWLTAALFGLVYGAAVIVEETEHGGFDEQELEGVHLSIGINHAVIEDPALFLAFGLNPFWLWIPRLIMAVFAIRLLFLYHRLMNVFRRPALKQPL